MNKDVIIEICEQVLSIICEMDNEFSANPTFKHSFIFPKKVQKKGNVVRISEQEFRFLFVDNLKAYISANCGDNIFYSVEVPTTHKYLLKGKETEDWTVLYEKGDSNNQSASIDLSIFIRNDNKYTRSLNIEFKYNHKEKSIAKDVLKLIAEPESGAFIILLQNANKRTFTALHKKLYDTFNYFSAKWHNSNKSILIVICIIKQAKVCYYHLTKDTIKVLNEMLEN